MPPVPPSVPETGSAITVCVGITSGTLGPGQTATVNLATILMVSLHNIRRLSLVLL